MLFISLSDFSLSFLLSPSLSIVSSGGGVGSEPVPVVQSESWLTGLHRTHFFSLSASQNIQTQPDSPSLSFTLFSHSKFCRSVLDWFFRLLNSPSPSSLPLLIPLNPFSLFSTLLTSPATFSFASLLSASHPSFHPSRLPHSVANHLHRIVLFHTARDKPHETCSHVSETLWVRGVTRIDREGEKAVTQASNSVTMTSFFLR